LAARYGDLSGLSAQLKASVPELEEAYQSFEAIGARAAQLCDYVVLTQKAVARIASKASGAVDGKVHSGSLTQLRHRLAQHESTANELLARVNDILHNLAGSLALAREVAPRASQLMRQLAIHQNVPRASEAEEALLEDDATALAMWVQTWSVTPSAESQEEKLVTVTRGIVYAALINKSHNILDAFIPKLRSQLTDAWGNYLHLCVILAGRRYMARENEDDSDLRYGGRLWDVLDNLHPHELQSALHRRDGAHRCALHYAAQYGMAGVCKELMARTRSLDIFMSDDGSFNDSPLHIAISLGHEKATETLLHGLNLEPANGVHTNFIQGLAELCIRSNYPGIEAVIAVLQSQSSSAESALTALLLLAARVGNIPAAREIVTAGARVNARNGESGRTALIYAAIRGHVELVRWLLDAGSDKMAEDGHGWTALEHASYRGLQTVVKALEHSEQPVKSRSNSVADRCLRSGALSKSEPATILSQLQRKEGSKSHILLNLGTLDLERPTPKLDIQPYLRKTAPLLTPESSLRLRVSATGCEGDSFEVNFPMLESLISKPWCFSSAKVEDVQIIFELYSSASAAGKETCIGTAVALLSTLHQDLEGGRDSLVRAQTLPLIHSQLGIAGTLTISLLIVRPFRGRGLPPTGRQVLTSSDTTVVGGHRGLGQNDNRKQHLQLGENTVDSCRKAIEMGTKVLEFDVQVTKDLKPIIYHDFLVGETGTDIPVHELSFSQFMVLSDIQSMSIEASILNEKQGAADEEESPKRARASSAGASQLNVPMLLDRMKATLKYSTTAFKPNIRGQCIHSPFATLADLLTQLDQSVTFDVEIKFPMLYEARLWKMDTFHMDLNLLIDTVLEVIYKHAGDRPIFFSSFSPDACIMLALKQSTYPIVFLSDGGKYEAFDERTTSLQNAVHFAKTWALQGIVLASEPLVSAPRLIQFVKDQGLYMSSYGAQNDDVELAKVRRHFDPRPHSRLTKT
jgi:glycerophosphodiester phosphodiesterase